MTSSPKNNRASLLTIAIPTFDREEYLRETLLSLLRQTEQRFEIILFDNASPYDIEKFVHEFETLSITILRNSENIGNHANFARAMAYPYETPYVMIFHDDDTIHPHYLKDAIATLDAHSEASWVGSIFIAKQSGKADMLAFEDAPQSIPLRLYSKQELVDAFMQNLALGFSSVVYRREALLDIGPDLARFYKWLDRPYLIDACKNKKAAILHFPYLHYRVHATQDSAQKYREHIDEMINLIDYYKTLGTPGPNTERFTTTSALRTAAANADSFREFKDILERFHARNLYAVRNISAVGLYWLCRILFGRVYRFFSTR